jgi:hypothetical protein
MTPSAAESDSLEQVTATAAIGLGEMVGLVAVARATEGGLWPQANVVSLMAVSAAIVSLHRVQRRQRLLLVATAAGRRRGRTAGTMRPVATLAAAL